MFVNQVHYMHQVEEDPVSTELADSKSFQILHVKKKKTTFFFSREKTFFFFFLPKEALEGFFLETQ